ncbi:MAG: cobalt-zinc-cadmium efflux system outer membrane protein [Gammaproteobacteria bacterium]|jgi:cobalt-zinc-cadmium efflux system outer membrane protein
MWVKFTNRVALGCLLLALCNATVAQSPSTAEEAIDFDKAIAKTLESNPALLAFGYQIEAQQGRLMQSGIRPGVELGVMLENAAGTGDFSGVSGAEATISLAWSLERGKRERRVDAARAGLSLLESEAELRRLEAAADTARMFLMTLANQAEVDLSDEAVDLAEKTVAVVRKRVQAGRTAKADLARAEVDLSRMQLEREDLEHELLTSIRSLAAQWGETRPAFTGVRGNLADLPEPDSFAELVARVEQSPNLRRFLSERRLREAELRRIEADAKPDWRLTAGVRQLQLSDDQALVAGITIPLGAKKRNHGNTAAARAEIARSDADRAATRIQIETRLFALYEELKHSLHRAITLRDDILPRVESALSETQRAYEMGRYSYFELRAAQDDALQARTEVTVALIDAHRNVLEIEALTGATLSPPTR